MCIKSRRRSIKQSLCMRPTSTEKTNLDAKPSSPADEDHGETREQTLYTVCFLDTFTLSCLSSSIQQQEVKPNGEEEKKIGREEPDGLCSCLLTSCESFLPSQSHTSFSLLLLRLAQCESVRETDLTCWRMPLPCRCGGVGRRPGGSDRARSPTTGCPPPSGGSPGSS